MREAIAEEDVSMTSHRARYALEKMLGYSIAQVYPVRLFPFLGATFGTNKASKLRPQCYPFTRKDVPKSDVLKQQDSTEHLFAYMCIADHAVVFVTNDAVPSTVPVSSVMGDAKQLRIPFSHLKSIQLGTQPFFFALIYAPGHGNHVCMGIASRYKGCLIDGIRTAFDRYTLFIADKSSLELEWCPNLHAELDQALQTYIDNDARPRSMADVLQHRDGHVLFNRGRYSFYAPRFFADTKETQPHLGTTTLVRQSSAIDAFIQGADKTWHNEQCLICNIHSMCSYPTSFSGSQRGNQSYEFRFRIEDMARTYALQEHTDVYQGPSSLMKENQLHQYIVYHNEYFADRDEWNAFGQARHVCTRFQPFLHDHSSYEYHLTSVCTQFRSITVVGVRRHSLPPFMDTFQDVVFVHFDERKVWREDREAMAQHLEDTQALVWTVADSLQASEFHELVPDFIPYADLQLLALNVDNFVCDEERYRKCSHEFGIVPQSSFIGVDCYSLVYCFCSAVYKIIHQDDMDVPRDDAIESPMAVVGRIETQVEHDHGPACHDLKRRISRYICYCIDHEFKDALQLDMSVQTIVSCIQSLQLSQNNTLHLEHVIAYLLDVRYEGMDGSDVCLADTLSSACKRGSFSCNQSVLSVCLAPHGEYGTYMDFLCEQYVQQAERMAWKTRLVSTLLHSVNEYELVEATFTYIDSLTLTISSDTISLVSSIEQFVSHQNVYIQSWATHSLFLLINRSKGFDVGPHLTELLIFRIDEHCTPYLLRPTLRTLGCLITKTGYILGEDQETVLVDALYRTLSLKVGHLSHDAVTILSIARFLRRLLNTKETWTPKLQGKLLQSRVQLVLLQYLSDFDTYASVALDLILVLVGLFQGRQESKYTQDPKLVDSIPSLLHIATADFSQKGRERTMAIVQLFSLLSMNSRLVLNKMVSLGVDSILRQIDVRLQSSASDSERIHDLIQRMQEPEQLSMLFLLDFADSRKQGSPGNVLREAFGSQLFTQRLGNSFIPTGDRPDNIDRMSNLTRAPSVDTSVAFAAVLHKESKLKAVFPFQAATALSQNIAKRKRWRIPHWEPSSAPAFCDGFQRALHLLQGRYGMRVLVVIQHAPLVSRDRLDDSQEINQMWAAAGLSPDTASSAIDHLFVITVENPGTISVCRALFPKQVSLPMRMLSGKHKLKANMLRLEETLSKVVDFIAEYL